jgi:competence ComEA-like helix-hairpin-helix protein
MLKKLSILIGLTETEIKVLLFLISAFILGFGYKTFFKHDDAGNAKNFDYSREDSIFFTSGNEYDSAEIDKSVDYKREVLDFNEGNFTRSNARKAPEEKSININSAKLEDLILLPGIGESTAKKILNLRKKTGGFKALKDLLEVKGIGEVKFNKIKKYIFIE